MANEGFNTFVLGQPVITPAPGDSIVVIHGGNTSQVIFPIPASLNDQSAGSYTVLATDNGAWIEIGAFTYTLAQAGSIGFLSGWRVTFLNVSAGNATVNTTTSIFKGIGGGTSLVITPNYWAEVVSDGTNWVTKAR